MGYTIYNYTATINSHHSMESICWLMAKAAGCSRCDCRAGKRSFARCVAEEPNDPESIQKSFARHLEYSLACTRFKFTMQATASTALHTVGG